MMRTYGRVYNPDGTYVWEVVETDANGFHDEIYLTTLCQVLQGQPGESPFYSNYGIPGLASVQTQIPPDFFLARTQAQFAPFFANLQITKIQSIDARGNPQPAYEVIATTHQGAIIGARVAT